MRRIANSLLGSRQTKRGTAPSIWWQARLTESDLRGVVGNGFAINLAIGIRSMEIEQRYEKQQIHPTARSSDVIEPLSRIRIATQAPKSLKSERPDFSAGFCRLVDQTLRKKPMPRPLNFERIVAQFGND